MMHAGCKQLQHGAEYASSLCSPQWTKTGLLQYSLRISFNKPTVNIDSIFVHFNCVESQKTWSLIRESKIACIQLLVAMKCIENFQIVQVVELLISQGANVSAVNR
jgi:hypothetical protein